MNNAQVQNAIESIQSQLRSATSPAHLAILSIAADGLLSCASPEMEARIRAVQAAVEKREQEVKSAETSETISHNQEKGRLDIDDTKELDSLAVESTKVYEKFRLFHAEELADKKKDTENLRELEEVVKADKPISEELLVKNTKTPEQIKVARERGLQIVEAEKIAKTETEFRATEIERLKGELKQSPSHKHEEIKAQIEKQEIRQIEALSVIGEAKQHYKERLKHAEHIYNTKEAAERTKVNEEVVNAIVSQFKEMISVEEIEALVGPTETMNNIDNKGHIKWLKSIIEEKKAIPQLTREERQQMRDAVIQDPDVVKAIKNVARKYQENSSSSLTPPKTPNVKGSITNQKGRGD